MTNEAHDTLCIRSFRCSDDVNPVTLRHFTTACSPKNSTNTVYQLMSSDCMSDLTKLLVNPREIVRERMQDWFEKSFSIRISECDANGISVKSQLLVLSNEGSGVPLLLYMAKLSTDEALSRDIISSFIAYASWAVYNLPLHIITSRILKASYLDLSASVADKLSGLSGSCTTLIVEIVKWVGRDTQIVSILRRSKGLHQYLYRELSRSDQAVAELCVCLLLKIDAPELSCHEFIITKTHWGDLKLCCMHNILCRLEQDRFEPELTAPLLRIILHILRDPWDAQARTSALHVLSLLIGEQENGIFNIEQDAFFSLGYGGIACNLILTPEYRGIGLELLSVLRSFDGLQVPIEKVRDVLATSLDTHDRARAATILATWLSDLDRCIEYFASDELAEQFRDSLSRTLIEGSTAAAEPSISIIRVLLAHLIKAEVPRHSTWSDEALIEKVRCTLEVNRRLSKLVLTGSTIMECLAHVSRTADLPSATHMVDVIRCLNTFKSESVEENFISLPQVDLMRHARKLVLSGSDPVFSCEPGPLRTNLGLIFKSDNLHCVTSVIQLATRSADPQHVYDALRLALFLMEDLGCPLLRAWQQGLDVPNLTRILTEFKCIEIHYAVLLISSFVMRSGCSADLPEQLISLPWSGNTDQFAFFKFALRSGMSMQRLDFARIVVISLTDVLSLVDPQVFLMDSAIAELVIEVWRYAHRTNDSALELFCSVALDVGTTDQHVVLRDGMIPVLRCTFERVFSGELEVVNPEQNILVAISLFDACLNLFRKCICDRRVQPGIDQMKLIYLICEHLADILSPGFVLWQVGNAWQQRLSGSGLYDKMAMTLVELFGTNSADYWVNPDIRLRTLQAVSKYAMDAETRIKASQLILRLKYTVT